LVLNVNESLSIVYEVDICTMYALFFS